MTQSSHKPGETKTRSNNALSRVGCVASWVRSCSMANLLTSDSMLLSDDVFELFHNTWGRLKSPTTISLAARRFAVLSSMLHINLVSLYDAQGAL